MISWKKLATSLLLTIAVAYGIQFAIWWTAMSVAFPTSDDNEGPTPFTLVGAEILAAPTPAAGTNPEADAPPLPERSVLLRRQGTGTDD